jgi:hypothetical protein
MLDWQLSQPTGRSRKNVFITPEVYFGFQEEGEAQKVPFSVFHL